MRTSRLIIAVLSAPALLLGSSADAQIRVNPTGVNVSAQGATTVFLTFGGLAGHEAVEAFWCGELIPAAPAVGLRCDPATIFGSLPFRFTQAASSGTGAMTDIMTIPPSVSRRAYQAAAAGATSSFFYVRRFRSPTGGPDQFVAVTCRLTGGGARTPLSLTNVVVNFLPEAPVLQVVQGSLAPKLEARVSYTGTGRLVGRWEIVLPGDDLPTDEDLLTEATLPLERRGTQRRYTQLSRFNVFLPPTGRVTIPGPDPSRLPTQSAGAYYVLLRIEASTDKEGDSNLGSVGAGTGVVPSSGVAGFPMPVLRYIVGSGQSNVPCCTASYGLDLDTPADGATVDLSTSVSFRWQPVVNSAGYQIEFKNSSEEIVFRALTSSTRTEYSAPPWLPDAASNGSLEWRVTSTDAFGRRLAASPWRSITFR